MPEVVVVVPCYDEAARLDLPAFKASLARDATLSFVFMNDGSTDDTGRMLDGFAAEYPGRVRALHLATNLGKGEAVRRGVLAAAEDAPRLIGYWDADLATPLDAIPDFVACFADSAVQIVLGSRVQLLGRRIRHSAWRHYAGRVCATAVSLLLDLGVYDTQCGAKLLRATPTMLGLFGRPFELRWCFDAELLARLLGLEARGEFDVGRQCRELPLAVWEDAPGSKLGLRQVPTIAAELLRLRAIVAAERRGRSTS
jgi:glycosyltransferase involved in cell wall biosynthesis